MSSKKLLVSAAFKEADRSKDYAIVTSLVFLEAEGRAVSLLAFAARKL